MTDFADTAATLNEGEARTTQTVRADRLCFEDLILSEDGRHLLVDLVEVHGEPHVPVSVYCTPADGEPGWESFMPDDEVEIALRIEPADKAVRMVEHFYRQVDRAEGIA